MNKNKDNETNIKEHNLIKNVFLDTNIFSSAKFNYNSGNLCKFLENAKEYSIQVYITSVVETEIKKQIKEEKGKLTLSIVTTLLKQEGIKGNKRQMKQRTLLTSLDKPKTICNRFPTITQIPLLE